MADVNAHRTREARQQRIARRAFLQLDPIRSDLAPSWGRSNAPTQCVGEQLMAIADSQQWRLALHRIAKPRCGTFTPRLAVRDHRTRSRDHDAREILRAGKLGALEDARDFQALPIDAHSRDDPVLEIAAPSRDREQRRAGFDDEQRIHGLGIRALRAARTSSPRGIAHLALAQ